MIHAFAPITHVFPFIVVFCVLSFFLLCLLCFLFFLSISLFSIFHLLPILYARLWPFILHAVIGFTIFTLQPFLACYRHPFKIDHWSTSCPATTITLCWLCHASFPDKSGFVLSLTSLNTRIRIRVKLVPYQPL